MRRRAFLGILGSAVASWPLIVHAQGERVRRIGIVIPFPPTNAEMQARVRAFRDELRKKGWAASINVQFDERWTGDNMDLIRSAATNVVELNPKQTWASAPHMSALGGKADMAFLAHMSAFDPKRTSASRVAVASLRRPRLFRDDGVPICPNPANASSRQICCTTTGPMSRPNPTWQAWLREHKPPTLVVWGRNDPSFIAPGAKAFKRDLPDSEIHLLDAGHFALDEKNDEIAGFILAFLARHSV
jgi:pimeloyl-ACP methyl ester carboxylesterase